MFGQLNKMAVKNEGKDDNFDSTISDLKEGIGIKG